MRPESYEFAIDTLLYKLEQTEKNIPETEHRIEFGIRMNACPKLIDNYRDQLQSLIERCNQLEYAILDLLTIQNDKK